jgi:hypothetical protein
MNVAAIKQKTPQLPAARESEAGSQRAGAMRQGAAPSKPLTAIAKRGLPALKM